MNTIAHLYVAAADVLIGLFILVLTGRNALPSEGWVDAVVSRIMGAVAERNPQVILRRPNL